MTDEKREFYANFPVLYGDHWNWDDTHYSYSSLDLIFRTFLKFHLFFLKVNLNFVPTQKLSKKIVDLLRDALPAYVFYTALAQIDEVDEVDLANDAEDLEFDFERAWLLEDDMPAIEDGFQSRTTLLWDLDTYVWDGGWDWDYKGFHEGGPRWFLKQKPCQGV